MSKSEIQEEFLNELADNIRASRCRIKKATAKWGLNSQVSSHLEELIWEELQTVAHSFLVSIDGGTSLAEKGLISIFDEHGNEFDNYLHELFFDRFTEAELGS